ncbi:hypothetical protein HYU95_01445, partial [Candidatus Daviesbacteria bacterium]|nr:hypothetical protein [Candidatus Daviesbacteria bacterium]
SASGSISEFFRPLGEHPLGRGLAAIGMGIIGKIFGGVLPDFILSLTNFIPGASKILGVIFDKVVTNSFSNIVAFIFTGVGAALAPQILSFVAGFIAFLIITIALLWALIRLWFELIKAYIFILLDVVLAPFFIVLGLFPGSPISFGAWLRDILANLSAFPVTIAMFLMGRVFIEAFGSSKDVATKFAPPLIGNPADTSAFGALIGLGIILMTPSVVEMMKAVFKAPKLDTSAIGQAIGAGTGIPGSAIGTAAGLMTAAKYDITGEKGKPSGRIGRVLQRLIR